MLKFLECLDELVDQGFRREEIYLEAIRKARRIVKEP